MQVGIIGAGHWAEIAHLPSFAKCRNAKVVSICDTNFSLAKDVAKKFEIAEVNEDYHSIVDRDDIDIIDICSSADSHYEIALEAIRNEKSILCEKPLSTNYEKTRELAKLAVEKRVKTKMGFTFRYSPALREMKQRIENGFIGQPYLFNGFEQNSQFINPVTPFRWNPQKNSNTLMRGSLEEYAPHLIDLGLWLMDDITQVIGVMKNFVPSRWIRDLKKKLPINIEDATVWLAEFANGAEATFQSSFIAIGGYPGVEVRIFGSKGAMVARLVQESSAFETLSAATPDDPHFKPVKLSYKQRGKSEREWFQVYYSNLVRTFIEEVLNNKEPEGNFVDGSKVQEVEDAVHLSHLKKKWIPLPLLKNRSR